MDESRTGLGVAVGRDGIPGTPICDDPERLDPEKVPETPTQGTGRSPHQQLQGPVGGLEVVAVVLEVLEGVEDPSQRRRVVLEAELGRLQLERRSPRQLAHDNTGPIADDVGRDVLVGV